MAFGSSNTETVIFRYPARTDNYGDVIPGSGQDVAVEGCLFEPGAGKEILTQANQSIADGAVYAPVDAPPITREDQVVIRGETYEIIAKPALWLNEGLVIQVRQVSG